MSLIRFRPFNQLTNLEPIDTMMSRFRRDFDRLFETYFEPRLSVSEQWSPSCEASEDADEYRLRCELPGVDMKDVRVERSGSTLSIKATKESHISGDGKKSKMDVSAKEDFKAHFEQELTLPNTVDAEKISAEMKRGVLTVHLPKNPDSKPKAIAVAAKD